MAIEVTELINVELLQPESDEPAAGAPTLRTYTGLAVLQGDRWVAIAPELGTVAEGASADEALTRLGAAIQDVLEIAKEEHLPPGQQVLEDELAELILEHRRQSNAPVTMRSIFIQT